jgi:hypothetical protein
MEPKGFLFKHYLGLESSLQVWMGGFVHEKSFSGTIKMNLKVVKEKGQIPRTSYLNA